MNLAQQFMNLGHELINSLKNDEAAGVPFNRSFNSLPTQTDRLPFGYILIILFSIELLAP